MDLSKEQLDELQKIASWENLPEESVEEEKGEYFNKAGSKKVTKGWVEIVYTGKKMDGKKVYIVKWEGGNSWYYYRFDDNTLMKVECTDSGSMYNVYKVWRDWKKIKE